MVQSSDAAKLGRITAVGMISDVVFHPGSNQLQDAIDVAYKVKYSISANLKPMISP